MPNSSGQSANSDPNRRVILHLDLDCFYCQVEHNRLQIPMTEPLGVQQWHSLIAVNYAARSAGVQRHMTVDEAKKICPNMHLVHVATYKSGCSTYAYHSDPAPTSHKVSLDPYRHASARVLQIFQQYCSVVQKASVDEVFIDVTAQVDAAVDKLQSQSKLVLTHISPGTIPELSGDNSRALGHGAETNNADLLDKHGKLPGAQMAPSMDALTPVIDWSTTLDVADMAALWPAASKVGFPVEAHIGGMASSSDTVGLSQLSCGVLVGALPSSHPTQSYGWHDLRLWVGAQLAAYLRMQVWQQLTYTCSAGVAHNKMLAKLGSAMHKPNRQTIFRASQVLTYMKTQPLMKIRLLGGKLGEEVCTKLGVQLAGDLWPYTIADLQKHVSVEQANFLFRICRGIDDDEVKLREPAKTMTAVKALRPPVAAWENLTTWLGVLCTELHHRLSDEWTQAQRWPKTMVIYYRRQDGPSRSKSHPFPSRTDALVKSSEPLLQLACQVAASIDKANGTLAHLTSQLLPCASIAVSLSNFHEGSSKITPTSASNVLTQWMANGCNSDTKPKAATTSQLSLPHIAAPLPRNSVPTTPTSDPEWVMCDQCTKRDRHGHPIKVVRIAKAEWAEHQDYHLALDLYRQDLKATQPPVSAQPLRATATRTGMPVSRPVPTGPVSKRRRTTKKAAKPAPLADSPTDKGQTKLVFRPV